MITLEEIISSYREIPQNDVQQYNILNYNYADRVFLKRIVDNVGTHLYTINVLVYDNITKFRFLFKVKFFDEKKRPIEIILSDDYASVSEAEKEISEIYNRAGYIPYPF